MSNYRFNREEIEQDYYHWLLDLIDVDHVSLDNIYTGAHLYSFRLLAKDLHRRAFYSLIEHDENRATDGLALREEYLNEVNYPGYIDIDGDCSVLEMMIALARKMDFETNDPYDLDDNMDHTKDWFWEMIYNLGLTEFDDENYIEEDGDTRVDMIIDRMLDREYCPNGKGGLFPLECPDNDQREVEIWYQMSQYLTEKEAV